MPAEQRDPAAGNDCVEMEGRGEMIKAPIDLQDLRRRLYVKAKAEPSWRFWGIYVHVCKMETLRKAYALAKANNGAPGIDGVTFCPRAGCGRSARPVVRPGNVDAFSRDQTCRGKNQKPRSLDSKVEGDQDFEAYRRSHRKDGCESPGRSASERVRGLDSE